MAIRQTLVNQRMVRPVSQTRPGQLPHHKGLAGPPLFLPVSWRRRAPRDRRNGHPPVAETRSPSPLLPSAGVADRQSAGGPTVSTLAPRLPLRRRRRTFAAQPSSLPLAGRKSACPDPRTLRG